MKKIAGIITVCALLIACLSGCAQSPSDAAQNAFTETFDLIKTGDLDAVTQAITEDANIDEVIKSVETKDILSAAFKRVDYKINSVTETDKENVVINADISGVNMQDVVTLTISAIFSNITVDSTDEEIKESTTAAIISAIEQTEATVTTVDVNVKKTDAGWRVEYSDDLMAAMFGTEDIEDIGF